MGPGPFGWIIMVRLVHRQSCCVPMTVEPWSMSFVVMFEVVMQPGAGNSLSWTRHLGITRVIERQMSKACESIAEMSMWHWRSIAGSQPDECDDDRDCKVTLTFGSTLNAAFGIFRCLDIKPDNYRTLLAKLKSWSIRQDFWNIFLSWQCTSLSLLYSLPTLLSLLLTLPWDQWVVIWWPKGLVFTVDQVGGGMKANAMICRSFKLRSIDRF